MCVLHSVHLPQQKPQAKSLSRAQQHQQKEHTKKTPWLRAALVAFVMDQSDR